MDKDGTETTLAIGRRQESGVAFVRVADQTGVYAVPANDVALFTGGSANVKDCRCFGSMKTISIAWSCTNVN